MILTPRLELVPATPELLAAALAGPIELSRIFAAQVPATWPPEFLDDDAYRFTSARLQANPDQHGWWMYFVLLRLPQSRALIGSAGYKGPPDESRSVEIGYGIVSEHRRQGYATEALAGLLHRAFALPAVERVIGETLPELIGSIRVLEKAGFRSIGAGSEPGVIRFELLREQHQHKR